MMRGGSGRRGRGRVGRRAVTAVVGGRGWRPWLAGVGMQLSPLPPPPNLSFPPIPTRPPRAEGEQGRIMKREAMVHMSNAKLTSAAVAAPAPAAAPAAAPPAAE